MEMSEDLEIVSAGISLFIAECGWEVGNWQLTGMAQWIGKEMLIRKKRSANLRLLTDGTITIYSYGTNTADFACHLSDPNCFDNLREALKNYDW